MKYFILPYLLISILVSCQQKVSNPNDNGETVIEVITIKDLKIASTYYLDKNASFEIFGSGFKTTDEIVIRNRSLNNQITCKIDELGNNKIRVSVSEQIINAKYEIFIKRSLEIKLLGEATLQNVFNADIADKEGKNIKGSVHSNGKGVAHAVVSDGEEVTKTDENGIYYLSSSKKNGYVFVSIPSNFEIKIVNSVPQFYKNLAYDNKTTEVIDFELNPTNNENHVVAFLPDMHLANRNDDISQFKSGFTNDINAVAAEAQAQNKKFYAITLGDQTWDVYWYSNNYGLQEFKNQLKDFKFPIYHVMGNHDNDPYITNDFHAENKFRNIFGPTYYSFNLGKVHYIVLDNNLWVNTGGANGVLGERDYKATITENQINWLKANLSTISDKSTPIVIAMHIPFHSTPSINNNFNTRITNANEIITALNGFSNIKIMSGHTHYNFRISSPNSNISEYNIAAVSATWWWTGRNEYANNHICKDGSPGGYGLLENQGNDQNFYYKSIGLPRNYQFRAYDLNTVHITPELHTPNANATFKAKVVDYAGEYASRRTTNEILLNVWGYNPNWKITVVENGVSLPVQRITKNDPLHIISYQMKRLNVNSDPTSSFITSSSTHMFLTRANSSNSTLHISVEDEYGNKYEEEMIRPKAFSTSMK
jgi:predicted MPP superfamily phosphohydrolase